MVASTCLGLGYTYTIEFGLVIQHTTATLHWNSAKICILRPFSCKVEVSLLATYSPSIACLIVGKLWRQASTFCSSLHIDLVYESFHWLIEHFTYQIQPLLLKSHIEFVKYGSIYACKYVEGSLGRGYMPSGLGTA